mgnify:CR=1 FL=1
MLICLCIIEHLKDFKSRTKFLEDEKVRDKVISWINHEIGEFERRLEDFKIGDEVVKDEDGNVIKSPDTLTKVYLIDKNKKVSVATGKTTGNIGVSYAEGTLCFNMIKTIVMPQYPEYFTGVEG